MYYCTNNWTMHDSRGKIRLLNKYSINNDEKNSNLINFRVRLMKFVLSGLHIDARICTVCRVFKKGCKNKTKSNLPM